MSYHTYIFMQIYANDEEGNEHIAHFAEKNQKYFCLECKNEVALRSGPFIRAHFYHLGKERPCRIRYKTPTHLQIQKRLLQLLPLDQARMERPFKEIGRIADVVWEEKKLIFEIQVSFISQEEIEARNKAYKSQGYQVIWILHEMRFNRRRMTAAEVGLLHTTHYYTDINSEGIGHFYDQFSYHHLGQRLLRLFKRPIQLDSPILEASENPLLPFFIKRARKSWPLYFKGDIWTSLHPFNPIQLEQAAYIEKKLLPETAFQTLKKNLKRKMKLFGYILLDMGL